MRRLRGAIPLLLLIAAACGGADDAPAADAGTDSVPGMVTGTTGAPGPGTAGTPGSPAATNPDTIGAAADSGSRP